MINPHIHIGRQRTATAGALAGCVAWLWATRSAAWPMNDITDAHPPVPLEALPMTAAVSLLWWGALTVSASLLLAGALLVITEANPAAWVRRTASTMPAHVRKLVGPFMGIGTLVTVPPLSSPDVNPTEPNTPPACPAGPTATLELLDLAPVADFRWLAPRSGPLIGEDPPETGVTASSTAYWLVEPGDNFWIVARRTIDTLHPRPSLGVYWLELIELNRDRLPDPTNPDLITPGMVLRLRS